MKSSMTKFILLALAYIIPTMVLGMVWHFVLFEDLYESLGIYNLEEPIIPLGFTSMIIQGLILAYIFPYYSGEEKSIGASLRFNLIMGLFLFSVSTLANGAKIKVTSMQSWLLIQAAFTTIQFSISGILMWIITRRWAK